MCSWLHMTGDTSSLTQHLRKANRRWGTQRTQLRPEAFPSDRFLASCISHPLLLHAPSPTWPTAPRPCVMGGQRAPAQRAWPQCRFYTSLASNSFVHWKWLWDSEWQSTEPKPSPPPHCFPLAGSPNATSPKGEGMEGKVKMERASGLNSRG